MQKLLSNLLYDIKISLLSIICIIFFLGINKLDAQNIEAINLPKLASSYYIFVVQKELKSELIKKVLDYDDKYQNSTSFALVDGDDASPEGFRDSLNQLLNTNFSIPKQYLYYVIVGDNNFFIKYNQFNTDIFAGQYFLRNDVNSANYAKVKNSDFSNTSIKSVVDTLGKSYVFTYEFDIIKQETVDEFYDKRGNTGIGFSTGFIIPTVKNSDSNVPNSLFSYSITGFRKFNQKFELWSSLNLSFKIPNPKKIIRNSVRGQLDINSIISGIDQEINLDVDINGHAFLNAIMESRYFLTRKYFQPYVGIGLSFTNYTNINASIDTLITINDSTFSNGGAGNFGGFDIGDGSFLDDRLNIKKISIPLSFGLQRNMGAKWIFDLNIKYDLDLKSLNENKVSMNNLNMGVSFVKRFVGKRKVYYNYIRFSD